MWLDIHISRKPPFPDHPSDDYRLCTFSSAFPLLEEIHKPHYHQISYRPIWMKGQNLSKEYVAWLYVFLWVNSPSASFIAMSNESCSTSFLSFLSRAGKCLLNIIPVLKKEKERPLSSSFLALHWVFKFVKVVSAICRLLLAEVTRLSSSLCSRSFSLYTTRRQISELPR